MEAVGVVRRFDADEGIGVIDADATPGGCFVHVSAIATDGFAALAPGQRVRFAFEPAQQDGFAFRATTVWTADEPAAATRGRTVHGSPAYRSTLTVTDPDDPSRTVD